MIRITLKAKTNFNDDFLKLFEGNEKELLKHLHFTFYIQGISRALLQELARHRKASLSVKSTRYSLNELRKVPIICDEKGNTNEEGLSIARKYIKFTGNDLVDKASLLALENARKIIASSEVIPMDIAKYCIPESYLTELTWTVNGISLINFFELRSNRSALKEIRELAFAIYDSVPSKYKKLFMGSLSPRGDF